MKTTEDETPPKHPLAKLLLGCIPCIPGPSRCLKHPMPPHTHTTNRTHLWQEGFGNQSAHQHGSLLLAKMSKPTGGQPLGKAEVLFQQLKYHTAVGRESIPSRAMFPASQSQPAAVLLRLRYCWSSIHQQQIHC